VEYGAGNIKYTVSNHHWESLTVFIMITPNNDSHKLFEDDDDAKDICVIVMTPMPL
jgi:hypothetical protein